MTRHNEPEELLGAMLELPPDERDAFLDDQCGTDTALRAEVDRLRMACELPSPSSHADPDPGSFVEQLLGACPGQLWRSPGDLAPTLSVSGAPGTPPSSLGDRYEIERKLGHGGMGTVYLARDNKLKRRVALKMLPEVSIFEPRRRAMFEREACTAANLNHANVATVYEFEEIDGKPYISMEYVEGRSLRKVLVEEGPLSLARLLAIALQITEGLHAAHRQSIIHRDLKPANVMVTDEGRVKILDFGLAKALQARDWDAGTHGGLESIGSSGVLLGTPGYMSPEQARREDDVDQRTDLFSLGVVLYEMATGDGPFHRDTPEQSISAALKETPRSVTTLNSRLPPALADVVDKLLEKGRGDRYQSAEEVLQDLRALKPRELVSDRTFLTVAVSVAVIILAAVLWLYVTEQNKEPPGSITPRNLQRPDASAQVQDQIAGLFETFLFDLTHGNNDNAKELHARMNQLDPNSPKTRHAGFLWDQMKVCARETAEVQSNVGAWLEIKAIASWAEARDEIRKLQGQTLHSVHDGKFHKYTYKPARQCAARLTMQLSKAVQSYAQELPDSDIDGLNAACELLRSFDPRAAATLDERIKKFAQLDMLYKTANDAFTREDLHTLTVLRGKMLDLDPNAEKTSKVEALVNGLQNRRAADKAQKTKWAYEAFREGSLSGFRSALGRLDSVSDELQGALGWLERLAAARELVTKDPDAASTRAALLEHKALPPDLQRDGERHLSDLNARISQQRATALCDSIQQLCKRRQLSKATEQLNALEDMAVTGLDARITEARQAVADLRTEKHQLGKLAGDLREYLSLLQKNEFENAKTRLQTLKGDWQAALRKLQKYEGPDLLLDRARLQLWLGADANALHDAKSLGTPEGQLLCGQALYAQGRVGEALACFDQVAKADDRSARAFYWRGVCRHDLAIAENKKPTDALPDLTRAIELGFRSAYAHYRLALVHLRLDAPEKAIEHANKALHTPFALDDYVACFDGNKAAYRSEPKRFWRDVYFWRGQGHFLQKHWRQSIDDCTTAMEFDGNDAWCYFGRGRARIKLFATNKTALAEYDAAMKDFGRAEKLGSSDPELTKLLKAWKEYAEGIRDR